MIITVGLLVLPFINPVFDSLTLLIFTSLVFVIRPSLVQLLAS